MDKESLRNKLLLKLSLVAEQDLQSLSFLLTNQIIKLLHSLPTLQGQIGAGYLPLKGEVAPVYQELLRHVPLNLAYPVLKAGEMTFGLPHGMPKGGTWLQVPYVEVEPEWLLVPGLGFDLNGNRLGRGKGFFDRYLEDNDALRIGLCWSEQIFEQIPVESHDCHMDYIITETFCWDVSLQKRF
ncbi:MAG TPA: 5-formyltetrahydrofolate cyclo-ligase [Bacteriovoracaceae bacterium]|nr:5-formyltetrahydrofolate cyclo-ligase [Bacteriovoracaceae bacterium]